MVKQLAVMCLVAFPISPAFAACGADQRDARIILAKTARECVSSEARRLEPSGERPTDIATAAISNCGQQIASIRDDCGGDSLADDLTVRFRDEAIATVVNIRAKRR